MKSPHHIMRSFAISKKNAVMLFFWHCNDEQRHSIIDSYTDSIIQNRLEDGAQFRKAQGICSGSLDE